VTTRLNALVAGVVAASAVLAWHASSFWTGDYPVEAGPVIDSLVHGHVGDFLSGRPLMGPVSLILRAPFAALALVTGGGAPADLYDSAYRFGVFPCALAGGILGLVLYRLAEREHRSALVRYGALVLCTVNPLTVKAITYGHPEEILASALVVGALLAAVSGRGTATAVLLVLAVGTKQWALLAAPVLLLALPWALLRKPVLIMAGLGVLAAIPIVAADPAGFLRVNGDLLDVRTGQAFPTSIWWPFTPAANAGDRAFHEIPGWLGLASHPLIIVLSVAVALAFRADMRRDPRAVVPSVLALVFLLRAALDPVNNSYYHLPFLLTLIAADVLKGSVLASLVATAAFLVLIQLAPYPATQAVVYLICAVVSAAYLWQRARGRDWLAGVERGAAGPAVQTRSRGET
jgi:hypothetical protein